MVILEKVDPNFDWCCLFFCRYFMALMQEMAVKIDQGFLGAILALFNPATDSQDTKEKVTTAFCWQVLSHIFTNKLNP